MCHQSVSQSIVFSVSFIDLTFLIPNLNLGEIQRMSETSLEEKKKDAYKNNTKQGHVTETQKWDTEFPIE